MRMTPNRQADKEIAIGIVGPDELVRKIMNVIRTFPSFKPIPGVYRNEDEAPRLAAELAETCEVLLLAGPGPYQRVREEVQLRVPVHFVPLTDTDIYRALLRLRNRSETGAQARFSVDTLCRQTVERSLKEIGESAESVVCHDGAPVSSPEELADFHRELYERGDVAGALTAEAPVAEMLTRLGIPNEWVVPTDPNIVVALERALLSTETWRSKEAQIVVGLVNVDNFGRHAENRSSEHDVQKFKLDIHRLLLEYVESLDGYLTPLGGDEYLFVTTRGIFERETGGYKVIPLGRRAFRELGLSLSVGIGFGQSANEAGTHARLALRKAKEAGGNACFIVREDRALIGPLEMVDPVAHHLSLTDPEWLKKAEEAGLNSVYLSRLLAQAARFGKLEYKVHELAAILGITVRSTHRLLLRWADCGLVDVTGTEKVPKGRPRQIYRLTFLGDRVTW